MSRDKYDAVIFDMDGVILDTEMMVIKYWREISQKYNLPNVEETLIASIGTNREYTIALFKERYPDLDYPKYRQEVGEMIMNGKIPLKTGVIELLAALRDSKVRLALASSTSEAAVRRELTDAGVIDYFEVLVCGNMVKKSKPDPEIFLTACSLLNVEPKRAYGIEDSINGIRSVHAAGMHPIMVPDIIGPTDEMRELSEIILPSLVEVKDYLLR